MASFTPPEPPFEPDDPTPPPTLTVPQPPPEVGEGSPWAPADSENRDRILDWWRMWFRRVFFPWIAAFTTYWDLQWNRLATYINTWITAADTYISEHAIAGYGFRPTATDIASVGTTDVVFTNVDVEHRPIVVGDLALDESSDGNFGIVTAVIDDTHATVTFVGSLRGSDGLSFRFTTSPIPDGVSEVDLTDITGHPIQLRELVLSIDGTGNFGQVVALFDATHANVSKLGSLLGPQGDPGSNGLSWRFTATNIAGAGTTDVTFAGSPDPALHVGDLVVSETGANNYGEITVVIDGTHATVSFLGSLKGVPGADGLMHSVVAGENITIDNTDPANPIITANGSFTFTNFNNLNDLITADGNTVAPINGSIGVVFPDGSDAFFTAAIWIYHAGLWTAPQIWSPVNLPTNYAGGFPPTWDELVAYINLVRNTTLRMQGASLHEGVESSHPVWNATAGNFRRDKTQLRSGIVANQVPAATVVANGDGTYTLTGCTRVEIDHIWPTLALDGTDEAELEIRGVMDANGAMFVRLSQYNNGPRLASYAAFGKTSQFAGGTVVDDPDYVNSFTDGSTAWGVVNDTTGAPTVIDALVRLRNVGSNVLGVVGSVESHYSTPDQTVTFTRRGTLLNNEWVGGANPFTLPDGFDAVFAHPFTGTLTLRSIG